jgi:hypothetical protein
MIGQRKGYTARIEVTLSFNKVMAEGRESEVLKHIK